MTGKAAFSVVLASSCICTGASAQYLPMEKAALREAWNANWADVAELRLEYTQTSEASGALSPITQVVTWSPERFSWQMQRPDGVSEAMSLDAATAEVRHLVVPIEGRPLGWLISDADPAANKVQFGAAIFVSLMRPEVILGPGEHFYSLHRVPMMSGRRFGPASTRCMTDQLTSPRATWLKARFSCACTLMRSAAFRSAPSDTPLESPWMQFRSVIFGTTSR